MCGILGVFPKGEIALSTCQTALHRLRHRGPDDEGYLVLKRGQVYAVRGPESLETFRSQMPSLEELPFTHAEGFLGHRRLSIIDLSPSGHQPMSYGDGSVWIVYNGEVYNYLELREELEKEGFSFKTRSDTEVILAAYCHWGKECLHRFNGMWGLCIYDRRKHRLFCARDRFGVKPFYYMWQDGNFAFASEIKALVELPWLQRQPNPRAIIPYLYFGIHDFSEETFFRSIYQLPPGHCLEFDLPTKTLKIECYFHLEHHPHIDDPTPRQENEYLEKFRSLLEDAVRLRLRSDVPVGSCLSGGLDSSAIVCTVMKRWWRHPHFIRNWEDSQFHTFTAIFPGFSMNEKEFAEEVIRSTEVVPHFVSPTSRSLQEDLQSLVYYQEEPFSSLSIYAQYCIMQLAQRVGIKVLLDGQGADEILAGYIQKHIPIHIASLLKSGRWSRISWDWLTPSHLWRVLFLFLPRAVQYSYLIRANDPYFRFRAKEVQDILIRYIQEEYESSSLNVNLRQEVRVRLPRLLKYEDRNTMAFGIESRLPFLDYRLVQWMMQLPSVWKIHKNMNKYILRESLRGILPEKIRLRKDKIGFAIPQDQWIAELVERWRTLLLEEKHSFLAEYVDIPRVLEHWPRLLQHECSATRKAILWRIINVKLWHDTFGSLH